MAPQASREGWGRCRGGARRSRGSQEHPEGEEILVRGSPAASELERPLLGFWPSGLFSAPGACVPGSSQRSLASLRAAIFSWRGGREGTIYRSNNPRSLRQWNPVCVTRADIPGPPSRPAPSGSPAPRLPLAASRRNRAAPRALVWPKLAGPRASVAPPPLPVRHGALKSRSGAAGSPSGGGCESWGSVQDSGSVRGTRLRLGAPVPGRGSRSQPGRCPLESVHLSGALRFGFVAGRGGGCCMKEISVCEDRKNVLGLA